MLILNPLDMYSVLVLKNMFIGADFLSCTYVVIFYIKFMLKT